MKLPRCMDLEKRHRGPSAARLSREHNYFTAAYRLFPEHTDSMWT